MITAIEYRQNSHVGALSEAFEIVAASGACSALVLGCDKDGWATEQDAWLKSTAVQAYEIPLFGGVFPCILYQGEALEHGTLIIGLRCSPKIHIVKDMSTSREWYEELQAFNLSNRESNNTLITFSDGLAKNVERVIEEMYRFFGATATTIGCGAGSLDFIQKPCVISAEGLLSDVTLIVAIATECGLGVDHGWEIFSGPFLVTDAHENCINTLNYQPALDVYKESIETNSEFKLTEDSFFDLAKTHPFGISSIDEELLVRDPIAIQEKSLLCVGEVPQNSSVYLLKGSPQLLIASAGDAMSAAVNSLPNNTVASCTLIFDCISRSLFLAEDFNQELSIMQSKLPKQCESFGALTLGEICTSSSGPITLLNKSTVIAVF